VFVLVTFLLAGLVTAFGVSSPYWKGHPLKLYPGESTTINFNLQNNVGDTDVKVKAEVVEGADIASLKRDIYLVKAKTTDTMVPLKVTLPKDATAPRHVTIEFKTMTSGEGGMVTMGTGMKTEFDILVSETPTIKKEKLRLSAGTTTWIVIALIIIIVIIYYLIRKKPKVTPKKKIYKAGG